MKAAVYQGNGRIQTETIDVPFIGPDEALLKVDACGLCGTDIGKVTYDLVKPGTILGHEVAGTIVEIGKKVSKFKVNDRVVVAHHTPCYACHYCQHGNVSMCHTFKSSNLAPGGFAEYLRIPAMHLNMTTHLIPENIGFSEAVFMEPLACILRNIKRAELLKGDTVLIIGLGSVGLLTGQALNQFNIRALGIDLRPERVQLAKNLGFFDAMVPIDQQATLQWVHQHSQNRGADGVILTAGNSQVYSSALHYLRGGGKLSIFAGQDPDISMQLDVMPFYKNEMTIYASYSPSPIELKEAITMLAHGEVSIAQLDPRTYALDNIMQAMDDVKNQKVFKALIQPNFKEMNHD